MANLLVFFVTCKIQWAESKKLQKFQKKMNLNLKTVMELSTGMVSVQQVEQNFS